MGSFANAGKFRRFDVKDDKGEGIVRKRRKTEFCMCRNLFPMWAAGKPAVDAGKNVPLSTRDFPLPEAGKNRRKAVKGLAFLTVHSPNVQNGYKHILLAE